MGFETVDLIVVAAVEQLIGEVFLPGRFSASSFAHRKLMKMVTVWGKITSKKDKWPGTGQRQRIKIFVVSFFLPNGCLDSNLIIAIASRAFGWPENVRNFHLSANLFSLQTDVAIIFRAAKCARCVSPFAHSSQGILNGTKPVIDKNLDLYNPGSHHYSSFACWLM